VYNIVVVVHEKSRMLHYCPSSYMPDTRAACNVDLPKLDMNAPRNFACPNRPQLGYAVVVVKARQASHVFRIVTRPICGDHYGNISVHA